MKRKNIFKWILLMFIVSLTILGIFFFNTEETPVKVPEEPDESIEESKDDIETIEPIEPIFTPDFMSDYAEPYKIPEPEEDEMNTLYVSATGLVANEQNDISFNIAANPTVGKDINLYCNGEKIGIMYDDGTHGDFKEGDKDYTFSYSIRATEGETFTFYAELGDKKSNIVEIETYGIPTDKDIADIEKFTEAYRKISSKYKEDNIIPEDKYNTIYEEMKNFAEENKIKLSKIKVEEDHMYVLFGSGINYVYEFSY